MLWPVGLLAWVITVTSVPTAIENGFLLAAGTPLLLLGLIHCLLLLQLQLLLDLSNEAIPLLLQTLPHLSHGQLQVVFHFREFLLVQPLKLLNLDSQPSNLRYCASSSVFREIIIYLCHRSFYCIHHFASVLGDVCGDVS